MSGNSKKKIIFNVFTGQFDYVEKQLEVNNYIKEIRTCDVFASVGDLVMESDSVANKVDVAINNTDIRPVIGIIISKPTTTTCQIMLVGRVSGLSGLTKGRKVFLSESGELTSTLVNTGYIQCLGVAKEADEIDFNPQLQRVLRT